MDEAPRRGPGRPRKDKLDLSLGLDEPIESLPPVARNLLNASRRILERDGFAALTLSAIATEADESKASIGYYFSNKEGLVVALVDSLVHEANRTLMSETHRFPMGEQRLRALVSGERDIIRDTPGFLALLDILPYVVRDDSLRSRIAGLYEGYRQTVLDVVDGTSGPDESTLRPFAALMIAMVDGLSVQYALDPEGFDVEGATALWERMIRCLFQDLRMVDIG